MNSALNPARPATGRLRSLVAGLLLLTLLAVGRAAGVETVLLGDQFTDDERVTQTLPQTAKWTFAGGANTKLWVVPPVTTGELHLVSTGGGDAMALAYFTASGSPVTLAAVNDSVTLDFTAKLDSLTDSDSDFRVALFNSQATRPTGDKSSTYDGAAPRPYFNKHSGYQVVMNTGAPGADSFNIHERNNQGSDMPFASTTLLGTDNTATLGLKVKQNFAVRLKITKLTSTSVQIDATVNGVTVSRTDSAAILTGFDGFGLYLSSAALESSRALTISNVTVTSVVSGTTATLLNDTFADGERLLQTGNTSAHWFYAGSSSGSTQLTCAVPASADELVFTPGGVDAMTLAYFTASGSPKALADGESITVQANVCLDLLPDAANGIRFGLFNSAASRAGADGTTGVSSATYNGYLGYSVGLNPGASGGLNLYRRPTVATGTSNPFSNSTVLGTANATTLGLTTSTESVARVSMTITRLGSGLQIEAAVNGRSVVQTDSTAATTSFDTFGFFCLGGSTAFYDGPRVVLDEVTVVHTGVIPTVASVGKIVTETFDGTAPWATAAFVGTQATGTVTSGAYGTINVQGRVVQSGGMKLDVNSTGLSGPWSGALNSGGIAATNTETNLGKLTLAFDLKSSAVRPVRVRLESTNTLAGTVVSGTLEKVIYPAVAGSFQRYAFELSDMTATGGTFAPTSGFIKLTFQIEGGVDASSWPTGTHSLQVDNVYYAKPAYYVKPDGLDTKDGLSEANAFASIAKALSVATHPGDIVLIKWTGTTGATPDYTLTSGLSFKGGGLPGGWVTLKNYPGQRPLIQAGESSYNVIAIAEGFSGSVDYSSNLNYIEARGLRLRGTADTLPAADRGTATSKSNVNGISADGRYMMLPPHHLRFADLEIYNLSGGGASAIEADWWFLENCDIHDNCNWMIYAGSGISALTPWNFDGTAGAHHIFWLGNRSYRNECKEPWVSIGAISDGNGAIIDTFLDTRHGAYLGRVIAANNQLYENGGSGIHALKVNGADIVNNTAVRNSHSPALNYSNIFAQSSNDIVIANNVIVASSGETINSASFTPAYLENPAGVRFLNNVYQSDGSTKTPYVGSHDSGNVTTTDVKFLAGAGEGFNDYRLRPGSPALNAALNNAGLAALGVPAVAPVRDAYGVLRATDGVPDIGAFERQPATALSSSVNPANLAASVTFTATVTSSASSTPTGTVTFYDGATSLGTGALNASGVATLTTSALTAGSHSVTASYPLTGSFEASTSPVLNQTIRYGTTTALVSSANPANVGATVTFTATVTSTSGTPAGTVTFYDGATILGTDALDASGVAILATNTLAAGLHSVTATYEVSNLHAASTSSALSQNVQLTTTTAVTSNANPAGAATSVTFTATVTGSGGGTPTGSVTFKDGSTTLGTGTLNAGVATFSTSSLAVGSHSITAVYGPSTAYSGSTSAILTQTIQLNATTTALTTSANPANVGASVTFTATVSSSAGGTPTGTVTFYDNGVSIGSKALTSGVATLSSSTLTAGTHPITATYAVSSIHATSTSSILSQNISNPSATALTSSATSATYGTSVTFTATVSSSAGGTPTGTVTFYDNGVPLGAASTLNASGMATFAVSTLSGGTHLITATYNGSTTYRTSTSTGLTQTIQPAVTTTTLTSNVNPAAYGTNVTFTATVTSAAGTPSGTVTFLEGAATLGTGTLNGFGMATFATSSLAGGSHSVTATYGGSGNHLSSGPAALTQTIQPAATTAAVTSSANPSNVGSSVTFTATVGSAAGTPAGTVTFLDGAATLGTGTLNASGVATFATSALTTGSHSITVSYGGSGNHAAGVSSALTQTVRSLFDAWRADNFNPAQLGDANVSGASADPDGDGYSNLMEFAFGTNPNSGASGPGTITYNGAAVITLRAQPTVSIANRANGVDFRVVFGRRQNWVAARLLYTVQFSANLSTWEANDDNANPPATVATDAEMDAVTVPYPFFLTTGEKAQFFRVVVTLQ